MPRPSDTRLICPLTATTADATLQQMRDAFAVGADMVECRLDFLVPPPSPRDLQRLLADDASRVVATCRPAREGGKFSGDETVRLDILRQCAELGCAAVDVEIDVPADRRPGCQVILSHHDFAGAFAPDGPQPLAAAMDSSPATVNKLAFTAAGPEDAVAALEAVHACRKPTIALAMGEAGVLSRIAAGKFSAWGTFAALARGAESAPGQPTLDEMRRLYRWDRVGPATKLLGVIGCPVGHSMSPAIHNAAFDATGYDGLYVPLLVQPGHDNFFRFLDAVVARPWLDWRGLSVTIPHKENALAYVGGGNCDELSRRIGAVNTITFDAGGLRGHNTDYAAAIDALCHAMGIAREQLAERAVAVLGAGGAARSIVAALAHYGAAVTVYNRTLARAEELAGEFGARAAGLDSAAALDAEIIINCTPMGMHPHVDGSPLDAIPSCVKVVFDTIYNPIETRLLKLAASAGCLTVSGLEMFVNQAVAQFELWTGLPAPREVMRQVVVDRLMK